jgi:hypothetical protein
MELSSRLSKIEFEYESLRKLGNNDISAIKTQYESKIAILNQ